MNCVVIYNGVSGSGKSKIVDCIKTMYEFIPSGSKVAEYLGINNIYIGGDNRNPMSVGLIQDISVMGEYSRLLVKLTEGPQTWIDTADYNTLSKYLRSSKMRNTLVKLKSAVESSMFGCTNGYVMKCIEKISLANQNSSIFKSNSFFGDTASFSKENDASCINVFFVSIREPEQIQNFIENSPYPVRTLFVTRPDSDNKVEDGYTEDIISKFDYDYYITNPDGIVKIMDSVRPVMNEILRDFAENAEFPEENGTTAKISINNNLGITTIIEDQGFAQIIRYVDENGNEITPV